MQLISLVSIVCDFTYYSGQRALNILTENFFFAIMNNINIEKKYFFQPVRRGDRPHRPPYGSATVLLAGIGYKAASTSTAAESAGVGYDVG